ncbi:MAG TPA: T9SS type A sorting domain-containing protein [Saprospiraceae bacterium]|nr:T9SS type A sorting domain-containing protein [Saprospiraceae bacterium]
MALHFELVSPARLLFSGSVASVTIPGTGTFFNRSVKASEYDAYGTLKMPDATFDNAIRVKTVEVSIDSVAFDGGYSITVLNNTTYEWYVAGRPGPQVSVTYSGGHSQTVTPGFPPFEQEIPVTKSVNFVTALTTAVKETPEQQLGLDILNFGPNPAVDDLTLRFAGKEQAEELQLSVFDTQGRLLQSRVIRADEGDNQLTFSVGDWPAGQYFLSLSNGKAVKTLPWVKA